MQTSFMPETKKISHLLQKKRNDSDHEEVQRQKKILFKKNL